ncbi:MAG: outer membrane protein assembly factor BamD [Phycisphaerales bacterium]
MRSWRFVTTWMLLFSTAGLAAASFATTVLAQDGYRLDGQDEWSRAAPAAAPGSPEGQIATAREALAREQFGRAEDLASRFIKHHENHPLHAEALLIRGDAKHAQGNHYKALFDYEAVARLYPGSETFVTALEREMDIARLFARGTKRRFLGMRLMSASSTAEELLIRIQERLPGSALAEEAGLELGDFYFRRRDWKMAVEAYDLYISLYRQSPDRNLARRRLIASHLASFGGPAFDASGLESARTRLRELNAVAPAAAESIKADELIRGIDEKLATKLLTTARWYLRTDDVIACEFTMRRLVERYPHTGAAGEAVAMADGVLAKLPTALAERVRPVYEAAATQPGTAAQSTAETQGEEQ